jgi:hypothetical protein
MSDPTQHTIEELLAKYSLEPSLRDIYVEGAFDREVLERYFSGSGQTLVFYEISTVNVPPAVLDAHKLSDGNKQRVIALARELAVLSGELGYRCLVDRDLDHWCGNLEGTPRLRWTKYCSLELYFFTEHRLSECIVAAKAKVQDVGRLLESLSAVLANLYALRLADHALKWHMTWHPPDKLLSINDGQLTFDWEEYVNRVLVQNGKAQLSTQFNDRLKHWRPKLKGDARNFIRGHDFINVLAWTIGKSKGIKGFANAEAIERLFVVQADHVDELSDILN